MHIKHRTTCRICSNPHLTEVINLGEQYFQGSFIKAGVPNPPTRKVPNLIVRCDTSKWENACGLIQTKHTIPPEILYSNYWYQSGITETMRNHLKSIVDEALQITKLTEGSVLDIASNDSTLLRCYPPTFKRVGVDPSDIASKQNDEGITVINDIFPTEQIPSHVEMTPRGAMIVKDRFDIITSIACYYDVENPREFAQKVREHLAPTGIWIFEVAYWKTMLEKLAYDSCVNEHIIHYHLAPLEKMFASVGLKIFDAKETTTNGGSIMCFVTHNDCIDYNTKERKDRLMGLRIREFDAALDSDTTYISFYNRIIERKQELLGLIKNIKSEGKTIHILGASTKLNTILGYCGIGLELIEFAAERSPEKVGAKTISGIKLISEENSRAMKPDYYLLGPYHFLKELIKREESAILSGTKFIVPLPEVRIIDKNNYKEYL